MATGQKQDCCEMEKPKAVLDTAKETPVEGDIVPVDSDARNRPS